MGGARSVNVDERDAIATRFSATPDQVERDHLISHLLAVLGDRFVDRVHFIGGTALARTHLANGRLSEDIDLIAIGDRTGLTAELDATVPRALARTHGRLRVEPTFSAAKDTDGVVVRSGNGLSVRVQVLSSQGRTLWPSERRSLVQRYSDAPPVELIVPTLAGFVAAKTAAWYDRHAPRDLWDLWALSGIDAIDTAAAELYRRHGPTHGVPGRYLFNNPPAEQDWQSQLAGQTRLTVTAAAAMDQVRAAWARTADEATRPEDQ